MIKKMLVFISLAVMIMTVAVGFTACNGSTSVEGKTYVWSDCDIEWADELTEREKEEVIREMGMKNEDEVFAAIDIAFQRIAKCIEISFINGRILIWTPDGDPTIAGYAQKDDKVMLPPPEGSGLTIVVSGNDIVIPLNNDLFGTSNEIEILPFKGSITFSLKEK